MPDNKEDAYYFLGKALHFMQDLWNPYHTSSMVHYINPEDDSGFAHDSDHSDYEEWANEAIGQNRRSFTETNITFNWTGSITELGLSAATETNIPFGDARWEWHEGANALAPDYWQLNRNVNDLKSYIKKSQRDSAIVLYMFWQSVK